MTIKYSVIVPVFKREDEVMELIDSLAIQTCTDFELIIVDGSPSDALGSVDQYVDSRYKTLAYNRIYSKGLGISESRNLGAFSAVGSYLLFMDSDVILPDDYFQKLEEALRESDLDAFGGPDAAHESFTDTQKAISFAMTSILTTGGIRGKRNHLGKFKPRGFNMGMREEVFKSLGGFNTALPVGEDMDLSARVIAAGYKTGLIPEAYVYHKRRVSIKKFYAQVYRFGAARIMLSQMHHGEMKITHLFPLAFCVYFLGGLAALFCPVPLVRIWPLSIAIYFLMIFRGAVHESRSPKVGLLAIPITVTQFFGYAIGFIRNAIAIWVFRKPNGIFIKKTGEPESPL